MMLGKIYAIDLVVMCRGMGGVRQQISKFSQDLIKDYQICT